MALPYGAHIYVGEYVDDATCAAALVAAGLPLVQGVRYFNTTDLYDHFYNGAAWKKHKTQTIDFSQGSDTQGASATNYYKANALDTGIDECEKPVVLSGTPELKTLVLNVTTNTRPNNTVFTVMKNGVATALAVTVGALGTGVYSATGSIACTLGDKIALRVVTGATAGTLSRSCAAVLIMN